MGDPILGGIEAGGTKFVCVIARGPREILSGTRIPTTTPEETLGSAVAFFRTAAETAGAIEGFGVASFGPLEIDPGSPRYGRLMRTPKPGWVDIDLIAPLREAFGAPVRIDTDVNGAGLAEALLGAGAGLRSIVYLTVGTGIGGGAIVDGEPLRGLSHPEMGHVPVPRHPGDAGFAGVCPFHGTCLEGMASGPAMRARWNVAAEELPDDHEGWEREAFYLAHLCVSASMFLAPELIVMGGGVMSRPSLLPAVRRWTRTLLAGYLPKLERPLEEYIVAPALGERAGVLGALALAERAMHEARS
ncbi:MAG TPA: ROK family protein [Thermoanaerobaculia bacterium]|nr:ROK family protein [Thermoanaerobaculia bacterium]